MSINNDRPYLHQINIISKEYLYGIQSDEDIVPSDRTILCKECLQKTSCEELGLVISVNVINYCYCEAKGCCADSFENSTGDFFYVDLPKMSPAEYLKRIEAYKNQKE